MNSFPEFMKHACDRVKLNKQSGGMEGYVFNGKAGSQMVIWQGKDGGLSEVHTHDYDEYAVVVQGIFTGMIGDEQIVLRPGDECFIPAGVPHSGEYSKNYRAIDAFDDQRVETERTYPVVALQFGNCYQRRAHGFELLCQNYTTPCYLWANNVSDDAHLNVDNPLLEGYARSAAPSELWIGLPDGEYKVTITCFDPLENHGPFNIKMNGEIVSQNINIQPGVILTETFHAQSEDGVLCLQFIPSHGTGFIVNSLIVESDRKGIVPQAIFKSAPLITRPTREELQSHVVDDPETALSSVCDWLITHIRSDGYIGDSWDMGTDYWYTASMPIRALLAGYDITKDERYLESAFRNLDLFVGEQLPNGGFECVFRGTPTSELSKAEVCRRESQSRLPMSDIGSVVSALAVGSYYASGERKQRYVSSVRHFCDDWALRFQQPSGGFTDGQWAGFEDSIYSCATAIEAATFSLAHAITQDKRYLEVAEKAVRFLLTDLHKEGRMTGRAPHWFVHSGKPFLMETCYFGDLWYYDEGFITSYWHIRDELLRGEIKQAVNTRVFGSQGLLNALENNVWWPNQDIWNNAKSIGMVQTLLYADSCGFKTLAMKEAIENLRDFLCIKEYSHRLGIMVDDAERPVIKHALTTWSGMRMEATGFAGMTLAEIIKPGVLYLASPEQRTRC